MHLDFALFQNGGSPFIQLEIIEMLIVCITEYWASQIDFLISLLPVSHEGSLSRQTEMLIDVSYSCYFYVINSGMDFTFTK